MGTQLGTVVFVTWRESVEALLVIGILNAWLSRQGEIDRRGKLYLWAGVGVGLLAAVALGLVFMLFGESLPDDAQQAYQTAAVFVAAALIIQMVFWMRRHGRTLKRELESALEAAAARARWWSVFVLALIAVAREGSETVIFLFGTISALQGTSIVQAGIAAAAGLAAALATYYLLQVGSRILSWQTFFRLTELMLLFLAASLLMTGVENLVGLGILPSLSGRLWDTSAILPDSGPIGGLISALTGYRARPHLIEVLVYTVYWATILALLYRPAPRTKTA
jgi:high-affinity iron transporter